MNTVLYQTGKVGEMTGRDPWPDHVKSGAINAKGENTGLGH